MRTRHLVLLMLAASFGAVYLAAALPETILAGDMVPYRLRMVELFLGKIPYLEFEFEHLPGMILPMAAAWLLGGWRDLSGYAFAFAGVSLVLLLLTLWPMEKLEGALALPGLTLRWVVLTIPLLPLLLFRNDSFVVLLAIAGIWWAISGRSVLSLVGLALGTLSKGWPVVWFGPELWRRRWGTAAALIASGFISVAFLLSPSVQSIQNPQGIHTETLSGSVLGLMRAWKGQELQITVSATAYIRGPGWLTFVNLLAGLVLAVLAVRIMRFEFDPRQAFVLTGALIGAGLVAGPFLSAQYASWLGPFVASSRTLAWFMAALNVVNVILIATWFELFDGTVWWWGLMVLRNLAVIAMVAALAVSGWSRSSTSGRSLRDQSALGTSL